MKNCEKRNREENYHDMIGNLALSVFKQVSFAMQMLGLENNASINIITYEKSYVSINS